jgi:O-antigen/teichoic acid export membrane protein
MYALLGVFAGDFASKAAVVLTNIYLIQVMPIEEYAAFSLLFAITQFSYQAICGVIERLYISEYDRFAQRSALVAITMGGVSAAAALVYYIYVGAFWTWVAVVFCVACLTFFQIQRIKLQKKEKYRAFAAMDVFRNLVTLILILSAFNMPIFADNKAPTSIYIISVGALIAFAAFSRIGAGATQHSPESATTLFLLWERRWLVFFCLLSALVPYLPIFLACIFADESTIATYGVGQRYQAILSMLVLATNVYLLPKISNATSMGASAQQIATFNRSMPLIVVACLIYMLVVWCVMPILNGGEYDSARWLFVILSMASMASFLSTPYASLLLKGRYYFFMFGSVVFGIAVTVVVSIALIYTPATFWSYAIGSLAGYVVISLLFIIMGVRISTNAHIADKL